MQNPDIKRETFAEEKLTQIGSEESEALKTRRNKSGNAIRISLWVSI